jgi:hypothetical protein
MGRVFAVVTIALCFLTSCGDGGGISLTPEQERDRTTELLVPLMAADEDWPFEVDDDATKQVARCWADEMTNILGLTSGELESLLERALDVDNLDDQEALQAIVDDLTAEQQMELGFSVLGCFEENARTTDFLQLMSNSDDASMTTLTTIDPDDLFYEDEPNIADLKAEVKKLTAALEDLRDSLEDPDENTPVLEGQAEWDGTAMTTTTGPETHRRSLYGDEVELGYMSKCVIPLLAAEQTELSEIEYEEWVTNLCSCAYERITNEINYYVFMDSEEGSVVWDQVRTIQDECFDSESKKWWETH